MAHVKERRRRTRRESDDCSQCAIWTNEIARLKADYMGLVKKTNGIAENVSSRFLPKWVFVLVVGLYLGIAVYNSVQIRSLCVDMAAVQTKVEYIQDYMRLVQRKGR